MMAEEIGEEELPEEIRQEIETEISERENSPACKHGIYKQHLCIKCHINKLKGGI